MKLPESLGKALTDLTNRPLHLLFWRHIVAGRIHAALIEAANRRASKRIEQLDRIHLVSEHLHPDRMIVGRRREDIDHIPPCPKSAPMKITLVTVVVQVDELTENVTPPDLLSHL